MGDDGDTARGQHLARMTGEMFQPSGIEDMVVVGKDDGPVRRKLVFHAKACSAGDPADPLGCCKAPQLRGIFAGGNDRDHVLASDPHRGSDEAADSPPLLPQNRLSAILTPSAVSSSARHCRDRRAAFSRFWHKVLDYL